MEVRRFEIKESLVRGDEMSKDGHWVVQKYVWNIAKNVKELLFPCRVVSSHGEITTFPSDGVSVNHVVAEISLQLTILIRPK